MENLSEQEKKEKRDKILFPFFIIGAIVVGIPLLIIGYYLFAIIASTTLFALGIAGVIFIVVLLVINSTYGRDITEHDKHILELIYFIIGLIIAIFLLVN